MIPQVRALLTERNVTRAVIIDDAYDERPKTGDVEDDRWDRFFDDLTDPDEQRLAASYGVEEYDRQDPSALRRDTLFVDTVWNERQHIASAAALFADFEQLQRTKRDELEPLRRLLETELQLACTTAGRDDVADVANADVVFLDLYLGFLESEEAVTRAITRVKSIVDPRRQAPPMVVLLSRSPKLLEVGPRLRDDAELLGCQFRMIRKSELGDHEKMAERLYDLVASYPDAQKINAFLQAWDLALSAARTKFLKSIRTLDLADYVNLQALALDAEDEPVGDYVLDLYDLYLHQVLEGDEGLVRAAKGMNDIRWNDYPPAQFMPTDELIEMMDGALFQHETRTRVEGEITNDPQKVRLGDVFLGPAPAAAPVPIVPAAPDVGDDAVDADAAQADAPAPAQAGPHAGPPPAVKPAQQPTAVRHAFVVLSQACDLQHKEAEHVLLMRGVLRPHRAWQHESARKRTPVMRVGDVRYSVEWDLLAPDTWRVDGMAGKIADGYRRVRRFRTPFALQLQQDFISNLGRVGTLAAVPSAFDAGIRIYLKLQNGVARLLVRREADSRDAVCLLGRTAKGSKEKLLLSESVQDDFRRSLRDVLPADVSPQVAAFRDDPAFYRRFKPGLDMKRGNATGKRSFANTPHDVVLVVTTSMCIADQPVPGGLPSLIVEVVLD